MTIALVINGVTFNYPEQNDEDWGPTATDWAAAVTTGMLQKAGGLFTLLADVDFGANFGTKSLYYKTRTTSPADAGQFRLAKTDVVSWRNNAGGANLDLGIDSSDRLTFNGVPIESNVLTSAHIFVGNVSNVATDVAVSGDLTLANTGAFTVVTVGGSSAANIHTSQLLTAAATASNTASTLVLRDGSGNFSAGTITASLTGTASGNPPNARLINTTAPLTGGGDLSADRTIAMPVATNSVDGYLSAADHTTFSAKQSATLTSAHLLVGNVSNVATDVAVSGDLTLANTGAFTIANSAITNAKVSASAAIDFSKLAALASGNILVGSAGNVATSVAMSGDISITNAGVTAIGANKVTNAMLAQVSTAIFKGRTTAGTGNVEDLTATQATALLNVMTGDSGSGGLKGLVPAQATGDATKFLNGGGTWSTPAGAGDVVGPASAVANGVALFNGTTGKIIKDGGIGTTSQVLVGGTTPGFGNTPAASLPLATSSVRGALIITPPTIQKFTSGTGTYSTPAGVAYILVTMVGGGGGGAGGGATGSAGGAGGTGGDSTFGTTLLVANGGVGGVSSTSNPIGGAGGAASLGSGPIGVALNGARGGPGIVLAAVAGSASLGGNGASTPPFGGGGGGASGSSGIGGDGISNTGGGGGGGSTGAGSNQISGGGGGAGGYVYAIISAPAGTYSYAVGGAGTAGTATAGGNGGAGAAGFIVVEEHYY